MYLYLTPLSKLGSHYYNIQTFMTDSDIKNSCKFTFLDLFERMNRLILWCQCLKKSTHFQLQKTFMIYIVVSSSRENDSIFTRWKMYFMCRYMSFLLTSCSIIRSRCQAEAISKLQIFWCQNCSIYLIYDYFPSHECNFCYSNIF